MFNIIAHFIHEVIPESQSQIIYQTLITDNSLAITIHKELYDQSKR